MAKKHYTEWGKVFARLRIMYSETLKQQSQRLGFNTTRFLMKTKQSLCAA